MHNFIPDKIDCIHYHKEAKTWDVYVNDRNKPMMRKLPQKEIVKSIAYPS